MFKKLLTKDRKLELKTTVMMTLPVADKRYALKHHHYFATSHTLKRLLLSIFNKLKNKQRNKEKTKTSKQDSPPLAKEEQKVPWDLGKWKAR